MNTLNEPEEVTEQTPKSESHNNKDKSLNSSVLSQQDAGQNSVNYNRLSLMKSSSIKTTSVKQDTFVLLSNRQWIIESQPFAIIIWDNVIEQYLITDEGKFILSFRTSLPNSIIGAYLGAVEFLIALSASMDVYFISLEKLRHRLEFRSIFEQQDVFEARSLFNKVSVRPPIIGFDTAQKGLAVWSDEYLQYFQVFEWENYVQNLQGNSLYLEALTLLSQSVRGHAFPLNGLLYPNGSVRNGSLEEQEEYKAFSTKFNERAKEVISIMIESLSSSAGIQIIMEICLDLIIKTKNFALLYNEFMGCILEGQQKDPALGRVFFQQLASLLANNRLIEQMDIDFFVRIFEFSKTKAGIDILEKFLFFVISNFKLNPAVFNTLKVTAFNKKLNLFLFFVLLHDPLSKDNLDYLLYQIMELGTLDDSSAENVVFKQAADRLFAYVFNVFTDHSFFSLEPNLANKVSEMPNIQKITKEWFFAAADDFLLDHFPAKTVYLLDFINTSAASNPLPAPQLTEKPEKAFFQIMDPEKAHEPRFNDFLLLINGRKNGSLQHLVCLMHFYLTTEQQTINPLYFANYFSRLLASHPLSPGTATFYNLNYLEYLIIRVAVYSKELIKSDPKLLELLQNQAKSSVVADLIQSFLDATSLDFFKKLMGQEFFFNLMGDVFKTSSKRETEPFIAFLKDNKEALLKKSPEKFQRLLQGLPAEYLLSFAGQFKEDPRLQLQLFQALDERGESYEMKEENAAYYLSLLCRYTKDRVIAFLEKNSTLDINKKLEICKQAGHQRGSAFVLFKMADYHNALYIYKDLVKTSWEKRLSNKEDAKLEIDELIAELLNFQVDISLYKSIILELSVVIAKLAGEFEYRRRTIRNLFARLFSLQCTNLVQDITLSPDYPLFRADQILTRTLLYNFKNLTDLNEKISNLFMDANNKNKEKVLQAKSQGVSLVNQRCLYCDQFDKPKEVTNIFHSCKNMSHMSCHPVVDYYVCRACSENNIGGLKRNFARLNRSSEARWSKAFK